MTLTVSESHMSLFSKFIVRIFLAVRYEGTSDDPLYDMNIGRLLMKVRLFESDGRPRTGLPFDFLVMAVGNEKVLPQHDRITLLAELCPRFMRLVSFQLFCVFEFRRLHIASESRFIQQITLLVNAWSTASSAWLLISQPML